MSEGSSAAHILAAQGVGKGNDLCHRDVQLLRDALLQIEFAQDRDQRAVFPQRHAVGAGNFDNPIGNFAAPFGSDARRTLAIPLEADRDR